MYIPDSYYCVSFHIKKYVPIGKGGMILTDDRDAYEWFKLARYDGRHECSQSDDTFTMVGWNYYMTPDCAARGWLLFSMLPDENKDLLEEPDYPDLSGYEIFTKANRD